MTDAAEQRDGDRLGLSTPGTCLNPSEFGKVHFQRRRGLFLALRNGRTPTNSRSRVSKASLPNGKLVRHLFSDATVVRERVLLLTKSFIAVRGFTATPMP